VIVIDTHAWIWWAADRRRLSKRAKSAISSADLLGVSAISCWEVAMLVHHGRLRFDRELNRWFEAATSLPRISLLPLTPSVATGAYRLPGFHGDPADRMIVASALAWGWPLVTKDRSIRDWDGVQTIW
jgi:PIN domain nuclease of toxin-antitoxin system